MNCLAQVLFGLASYVPGVNKIRAKTTGGTNSARYCYSVWLRHIVKAQESGLNVHPKVIAELGPGDSLGIGIAALLCGVEKYFAFDVVDYANTKLNIEIFEELVNMFKKREDIPGQSEFPRLKPFLDCYDFPSELFAEDYFYKSLSEDNLKRIRASIEYKDHLDSMIEYKINWFDNELIEKSSIDLIYSQAVLEHVDSLKECYEHMYQWLKPGAYISHQIDFKSHGMAKTWYGHWEYSDLLWSIIRGNRPYLLNREPLSSHLQKICAAGFEMKACEKIRENKIAQRNKLTPRYRELSEDDISTSGVFVQAVKPMLF